MSYYQEMRELLDACGYKPTIYKRKPAKSGGTPKPLTRHERNQVERVSTERGYRRFTADMRSSI